MSSGAPADRVTVTQVVNDTELILQVTGELDALTAADTSVALLAATRDLAPPVLAVLDLSEVRFMRAAGVHVLRQVIDACRTKAVRIHLVVAPDSLARRILDIALPEGLVPVFGNTEEACRG